MTYSSERLLQVEKGRLDALFGSPSSIVIGTVASVLAVGLCYVAVQDPFLPFIALAFAITGAVRIGVYKAYWRAVGRGRYGARGRVGAHVTEDVLDRWRLRCIVGGTIYAALLGVWCFAVIARGSGDFAVLTAISTTLANTVGMAGRNYSSRFYLNVQCVCIGVPVVLALVVYGDMLHAALAFFYAAHCFALVGIATTLRNTLDAATRDEIEVRKSAGRLSTAFETVPSGLLMFDADGSLALANTEAREFLEIPQSGPLPDTTRKAIGKQMQYLLRLSLSQRESFKTMLRPVRANMRHPDNVLREGGTEGGIVVSHRNGGTYRMAIGHSSDGSLILRIDNVTEQRASEQKIVALSRFDALTGLANRSWFFDRALELLERFGDRVIMVAVIDVDHFKTINDTMGHAIGDVVLRRIADNLDDLAGGNGVCGRLGGDEFVIMTALPDGSDTETWCANLQSAANFTICEEGREIKVATSIGVYELHAGDGILQAAAASAAMDSVLARADFAQYRAKADDSITLCVYDASMDSLLERDSLLRQELAIAIRDGKLETHYQPIVHADTGRPKGVEALARWRHPTLGPISPGEFIPLAEQSGHIRDLTAWQLHDACLACTRWPQDLTVSVNLSARDFASPAIVDHIRSALSQSGLAPHRLTVEITETSLMESQDTVMKLLADIRAMGVQIALDDFGTGYCSLSYLRNLPFDILKIDRAFLDGIEDDPQHLAVLATIAALARQLDKAIVIEGVETERQLTLLRANVNFDFVQGFHFGRPMPAKDADTWLHAFSPPKKAQGTATTRRQAQADNQLVNFYC